MMYLVEGTYWSPVLGLVSFIPQLVLVVAFGILYYRDIPFCCFVQTFAFVTFNKVCTSQVSQIDAVNPLLVWLMLSMLQKYSYLSLPLEIEYKVYHLLHFAILKSNQNIQIEIVSLYYVLLQYFPYFSAYR